MPSVFVAISLAECQELLSVTVAGGMGGRFDLPCTGFIADSQFGYVIFDFFFFEKQLTIVE